MDMEERGATGFGRGRERKYSEYGQWTWEERGGSWFGHGRECSLYEWKKMIKKKERKRQGC
jgi:hypothetical protein